MQTLSMQGAKRNERLINSPVQPVPAARQGFHVLGPLLHGAPAKARGWRLFLLLSELPIQLIQIRLRGRTAFQALQALQALHLT